MLYIYKKKWPRDMFSGYVCQYWWKSKTNKTYRCRHKFKFGEIYYIFFYPGIQSTSLCSRCAKREWRRMKAKMQSRINGLSQQIQDCEKEMIR